MLINHLRKNFFLFVYFRNEGGISHHHIITLKKAFYNKFLLQRSHIKTSLQNSLKFQFGQFNLVQPSCFKQFL